MLVAAARPTQVASTLIPADGSFRSADIGDALQREGQMAARRGRGGGGGRRKSRNKGDGLHGVTQRKNLIWV